MKIYCCPECSRTFKANKRGRKDLQHHLWGAHKIDVIKSREIANSIPARIKVAS